MMWMPLSPACKRFRAGFDGRRFFCVLTRQFIVFRRVSVLSNAKPVLIKRKSVLCGAKFVLNKAEFVLISRVFVFRKENNGNKHATKDEKLPRIERFCGAFYRDY